MRVWDPWASGPNGALECMVAGLAVAGPDIPGIREAVGPDGYPFLAPPGDEFDTRITVIGNRAFGFRRLNRPADFRASGSGRIEHDPSAINMRCVEIAFGVSMRRGFQSMAYDFLYPQRQPVISEISYTYADWAVHECPGHWDRDLKWHAVHMWPEEAQVEDFLARI